MTIATHGKGDSRFDLSAGTIYHLRFGADADVIGSEMAGWHQAPFLGDSTWAELLATAVHAPITSAHYKRDQRRKLLFRSVPIPAGVAGLTKDSLLVPLHLDHDTRARLAVSEKARNARRSDYRLPDDILVEARHRLSALLVVEAPRVRPRYKVGTVALAPGDVVLLRERDTASPTDRSPRRAPPSTPWLIVSSDLWIELVSDAAAHTEGLGGLVRQLIAAVPLLNFPASSDEIVVDIPDSQPGLPYGGHCAFHRIRTRSTERILGVEGPISDEVLANVAEGLRSFLGLASTRTT